MTISEIFLEEMTSRTVLRMAKVGGLGELNEEAAGYYSQMYMTIKGRCAENHFMSSPELSAK